MACARTAAMSVRSKARALKALARMIPIHELLSRIRWDREYAEGQFKIGYYDRVEDRVIFVAFEKISFYVLDATRRTPRRRGCREYFKI